MHESETPINGDCMTLASSLGWSSRRYAARPAAPRLSRRPLLSSLRLRRPGGHLYCGPQPRSLPCHLCAPAYCDPAPPGGRVLAPGASGGWCGGTAGRGEGRCRSEKSGSRPGRGFRWPRGPSEYRISSRGAGSSEGTERPHLGTRGLAADTAVGA
ncbi:hypothetical protein mRhiFer1_009640 [Rhinolophus ferrumequinum]|uniref:Uncharacterized protein n=1 Tax=Rhinolophus ferrumequinum TaxID=59479 RepID=A0A7J7R5Z4_RHIFE|nr:hypothetical protein mRhiFer1_009640 [Rhinolophus ferrumequinum]